MRHKILLATLMSAAVISLALPTIASAASEGPLLVIALPADPSMPAIAGMTMAGHDYRMLFDTGASNLYFHLPVARKYLTPAKLTAPEKARGVYGEHEVLAIKVQSFEVGAWKVDPPVDADAVDMQRVVEKYGVDGILGVPYLAGLSWHWDNRSLQLSGYPHAAQAIADMRARMQCVHMSEVNGFPGIPVRVGEVSGPFIIDTGDLGISGGLHPKDRDALAAHGAVRASASNDMQVDIAGRPQPPVQLTQLQNAYVGKTKLDGLVLTEINDYSRFGRGFLSKFDEVLLDFGTSTFCIPEIERVDPDDLSFWQSN